MLFDCRANLFVESVIFQSTNIVPHFSGRPGCIVLAEGNCIQKRVCNINSNHEHSFHYYSRITGLFVLDEFSISLEPIFHNSVLRSHSHTNYFSYSNVSSYSGNEFGDITPKANIHHCNFCHSGASQRFFIFDYIHGTNEFIDKINDISCCNIINCFGTFIIAENVYIRSCNFVNNSYFDIDSFKPIFINCYFENNTIRHHFDAEYIANQSSRIYCSYSFNNLPIKLMKNLSEEKTCIDDEVLEKILFGVLPIISLK